MAQFDLVTPAELLQATGEITGTLGQRVTALESRVTALEGNVSPPPPPPPPELPVVSVGSVIGYEQDGQVSVPITITPPPIQAISFSVRTVNGTALANEDFDPFDLPVNVAAGVAQFSVIVQLIDDTAVESVESFGVELYGPVGCVLGNADGVVTVYSDDVAPPPPPPPPPTTETYTFLRPFVPTAPGFSSSVPNSRMRPAIINDVNELTKYSEGGYGIFTAWASSALNRNRREIIVFGGGHGSTNDGSIYGIDLDHGMRRRITKTFELGSPTAQFTKGRMFERDLMTPQNPERQPRSSHAYCGLLPKDNGVILFHANAMHQLENASWTGPWADWTADLANEEPWTPLPGPNNWDTVIAVETSDPNVYVIHSNYDSYTKDIRTGVVRRIWRDIGWGNEGSGVRDTSRDASVLALVDQGIYLAPHNGTSISQQWTRLFDWSALGVLGVRGAPGICYVPERDKIVLWNGRTEFGWFTPGDPQIVRWSAAGAMPANGPWSVNHKIHYMPELGQDIFLLVGGPDDDLVLVKLPF